jgi:cell division septum initiation protein DivIVA
MECFARQEDKAFIAHARDDMPALLAEVRRLREQVAALQTRPKPEPPG